MSSITLRGILDYVIYFSEYITMSREYTTILSPSDEFFGPPPYSLPPPPSDWLSKKYATIRTDDDYIIDAMENGALLYLQDSSDEELGCIGCESGADCPQSHTCKMP